MQLLMRRPQIDEFVSIAAPANRFDFSFRAPCPRSDLFIRGDLDRVAPLKEVIEQIDELKTYKDAVIEHAVVPRGQPLLRGHARAADFGSGCLSRQTARRACAHRHPGARYGPP